MTEKSPGNWKTVQDADLAQWLSSDGNDVRELIVEACLPDRKVTLGRRADGRRIPAGVESIAPTERAATLAEFHSFLTALLEVPPVLLKAAGAVAVKATSRQVRQFVEHPLVKSIRPNRRLARAG